MSIGPWQIVLIIAIVLIFFGPKRLPGLGKSVGEAIRGFKKGITDDEIDVTDSTNQLHEGEQENLKAKSQKKQAEKQQS